MKHQWTGGNSLMLCTVCRAVEEFGTPEADGECRGQNLLKTYDLSFDEGGCSHAIYEEPDGRYYAVSEVNIVLLDAWSALWQAQSQIAKLEDDLLQMRVDNGGVCQCPEELQNPEGSICVECGNVILEDF